MYKGSGREETVVTPFNMPIPSRMRAHLRLYARQPLKNVGANASNVRFIPTYCYDIDPTLGSTAMPFFQELGTLYRLYRLISSTVKVSFENLESFPGAICICPVNFDPGSNTASFANYFSSKVSKVGAVGSVTGASVKQLKAHRTTDLFAGAKWNRMPDNYTGSVSGGSPSNNWYWFIGCSTSSAQVNGMIADVWVDCEVEFWEITSPSA